jgi:hypothetical protein
MGIETVHRLPLTRGRIRRGRRTAPQRRSQRRPTHAVKHAYPQRAWRLARWLVAAIAVWAGGTAYAQFTSTPVTTAAVGQQYLYEVRASNESQGNAQIVAAAPLPAWLVLTPTGNGDATLAGIPTQSGTFPISLRAETVACRRFVFFCPVQTFSIDVGVVPNQLPTVVPPGIPDQAATVNQPFSANVAGSFTDPDGDPLTFTATGLSAGFTFAGGVIAGTPTPVDAQQSPFTVTVTANDGRGGMVSDTFALTVTQDAFPVVVAPGVADQTVSVGAELNADVASAFNDPDGDPLTFTAAGLPPGFRIVGSTISGTPANGALAGSPYTVTVTADDGRGGTVFDSFVLTILPLASADLAISGITAAPAPVARGTAVTWVVTVANAGPSPSGAVSLALEFAGTPVTFTANPCTLSVAADRQDLACDVGPIASGASQTVTLVGSAAQAGDVYVTASVASGGSVPVDPKGDNNDGAIALNVGETIVTDPAQALPVGATAIAAGSTDGDPYADVVAVAAGEPQSLLLDIDNPAVLDPALLGNGDQRRGLSSVPLAFGSAGASAAVAVADLDGDADLDVVVANGPGTASTAYRNDGNGVFAQLATLGAAARNDRAVAVGDANGDGRVDIVIASATGNTLYVNAGGGSFTETALPGRNGAGAIAVALVDVAGSALPDLVFVYAGGPTVRHENLGNGSFGAAVTIDSGQANGIAAADFNRDGRADLVLARSSAGGSSLPSNPVYLNNNAGGFVAVSALGATPTNAVLAGDVDGDGIADIVAINATGAHQVYIGDGNGNFQLHGRVLVAKGATTGALGPIGRLQRTDLVLAAPDAIRVFFNDGHGNLGLGDTGRPVIQLVGTPEVALEVQTPYTDAGATATDDVDGALTPTVTNPVDSNVVGTYTVTYNAIDSAGNAAAPVTRTVHVNARANEGGGGGGATDLDSLLLLALGVLVARVLGRARRVEETP